MSDACCSSTNTTPSAGPHWRRLLWIALVANFAMFAIEIGAGFVSHSASLKADALDFFGDAANYAISLAVAGMVLRVRARAAMLKGATLLVLGLGILVSTVWAALHGTLPVAATMGVVGLIALAVNGAVAAMFYRFRTGDANMRSVWLCARNDAIGNLAVLAAAVGVFGSGTAWPDLAVAVIIATLGLSSGFQILRHAAADMRSSPAPIRSRSAVVS